MCGPIGEWFEAPSTTERKSIRKSSKPKAKSGKKSSKSK